MKKIIGLLLAAAMLPVIAFANDGEENLTMRADITADVQQKAGEELLHIKDGNRAYAFTTDLGSTVAFPYHVDFDFGEYMVELHSMDLYSICGPEMGMTDIDIDIYDGEKYIPLRTGVKFTWKIAENYTTPEFRTVHFSEKPQTNKVRITVNSANLEWGNFRIDEIEFMGRVSGILEERDLSGIAPMYYRVKTGGSNPLPKSVLYEKDGVTTDVPVTWENLNLNKEGIYIVNGTAEYYGGSVKAIVDIYDPKKISAGGYVGTWCENILKKSTSSGLLGGISNYYSYTLKRSDAAKIVFRNSISKLIPVSKQYSGLDENNSAYAIYGSVLESGAFDGIADAGFEADKKLTRIEAVKIMNNLGKIMDAPDAVPSYGDIAALSEQDSKLLKRAYGSGIISDSNAFRPFDAITTAEFLTMLLSSGSGDMQSYSFFDNGAELANPNMGIFNYYYDDSIFEYDLMYPYDETFDDMPMLNVTYIRIPWGNLEPEEDQYDFSIIDTQLQRNKQLGRQIALRVTTMESYPNATPDWVFDKGAEFHQWNNIKAPIYDDPVYLENLEDLLSEVAKRYEGDDLAYVDIGYGIWGEGHVATYGGYLDVEIIEKQMELYKRCFPNTQIIMTDDGGYGWDNNFFDEYKDKMIELQIGYRDDSFFGITSMMEWRNPDEYLETEGIWQQSPVVMEPDHYATLKSKGAWGDGTDLLEQVELHHATYFGLHGLSRAMYFENPELMQGLNMRLGYRILPESVSISKTAFVHGTVALNVDWKNVAAAPCYKGGYPALTLTDEAGNIVTTMVDYNFNVKDLAVAEPGKAQAKTEEAEFILNDLVDSGTYKVYLSLGDIDGTPRIAMPLDTETDGERRYYIGDITVQGEYAVSVEEWQEDGNIWVRLEPHDNISSYSAYNFDILYIEEGGGEYYSRFGEMNFTWDKDIVSAALAAKESVLWDLDLSLIPEHWKYEKITDTSFLAGKTFKVYLQHRNITNDSNRNYYMISDEGRKTFIGRVYFDNNSVAHYTPPEEK